MAACMIMIGAAIVLSIWMIDAYSKQEREARMQQYYLLEMDAKLIAAGIKKPEDAVANKMKEK